MRTLSSVVASAKAAEAQVAEDDVDLAPVALVGGD